MAHVTICGTREAVAGACDTLIHRILTSKQGMTGFNDFQILLLADTFVDAARGFDSEKHTEKLCQHSFHEWP